MNDPRRTRGLRPTLWTLAVLGLIAILAWRAGTWTPSSTSTDGRLADGTENAKTGLTIYPADGRAPAPDLEGTTLDGDSFALADVAGKIVVLNVWGSWCGPCRAETPDLVRLAREYAGRGVRFVGINTRDNPAAANAFVSRFEVPYPSVEDDDGRLLLNFRQLIPAAAVPSSLVIDRQGNVAARVVGRVTYRTLEGLLDDEIARGGGR